MPVADTTISPVLGCWEFEPQVWSLAQLDVVPRAPPDLLHLVKAVYRHLLKD